MRYFYYYTIFILIFASEIYHSGYQSSPYCIYRSKYVIIKGEVGHIRDLIIRITTLFVLLVCIILLQYSGLPADNAIPTALPEAPDMEEQEIPLEIFIDKPESSPPPLVTHSILDFNDIPEITDDMIETILAFSDTYYESLSTLTPADVTGYFDHTDPAGYQYAKENQTILDITIGLRRLQPTDLTITRFSYELMFLDAREDDDGRLRIMALESQSMDFSCIPGTTSYESGIYRSFTFNKSEDGYVLVRHSMYNDSHIIYDEQIEAEAKALGLNLEGLTHEQADMLNLRAKNAILLEAAQQIALLNGERKALLDDSPPYEPEGVEYAFPYDRQAALSYANMWVDPKFLVRNPDFSAYDGYGGNCANFVSQSLFAGGIPMDITGASGVQWKWYSDDIVFAQVARGRSSAWSGVGEFYFYADNNTGKGLVAVTEDNPFSGREADVLQLYALGKWRHEVLITDVVYDKDGNVIDYLIRSNTADRMNYPATAHSYSGLRVIKILGYN